MDKSLQPLIGITTASVLHNGLLYNRAYNAIARAVAAAGGLPVYIPTKLDDDSLRALYERLDGLLLPGGPDIDPVYYGEERHPTTVVDAARDALEVPLVRWAMDDDLPLFGICRGHQVINVALGGRLVQDIPSQLSTNGIVHDTQPRDHPAHPVSVQPDSKLASILGDTQLSVNSLHHQAVTQPAPAMRVTAVSPDGIVEAVEAPGKHFALTVQWHPEDLYENDDASRRLFEAFVEAARERAAARDYRRS